MKVTPITHIQFALMVVATVITVPVAVIGTVAMNQRQQITQQTPAQITQQTPASPRQQAAMLSSADRLARYQAIYFRISKLDNDQLTDLADKYQVPLLPVERSVLAGDVAAAMVDAGVTQ